MFKKTILLYIIAAFVLNAVVANGSPASIYYAALRQQSTHQSRQAAANIKKDLSVTTSARPEYSVKKIEDLKPLAPKSLLLSVDWNIPMDKETGRIGDDLRIRVSIPTIKAAFEQLPTTQYLYILSHLGRPKGGGFEEALSLQRVITRAKEICRHEGIDALIIPLPYDLGQAQERIREAKSEYPGLRIIFVFENIRFYPEEKSKDEGIREAFGRRIIDTAQADAYINEAFDKCHRGKEASMGLGNLFGKECSVAGINLANKIEQFIEFERTAKHPLVFICGGTKYEKLEALGRLATHRFTSQDTLVIIGALAYPWLQSEGRGVGKSLLPTKPKAIKAAREGIAAIKKAQAEKGFKIIVPADYRIKGNPENSVSILGEEDEALDIGTDTIASITEVIDGLKDRGAVILNGGAGVFEDINFRRGTREILRHANQAVERGVTVLTVGGDMNNAITICQRDDGLQISDRILRVTGGGVVFDVLDKGAEGLPPIAIVMRYNPKDNRKRTEIISTSDPLANNLRGIETNIISKNLSRGKIDEKKEKDKKQKRRINLTIPTQQSIRINTEILAAA